MCCYRKWVERLLYCITPTYLLHKILGCSFWIYWMQHTVVFHGHMPPHPNDFWRILKLGKWNYQGQLLQMCSSSYYPLFPHRYYHYSKNFWSDLVTNIVQMICLPLSCWSHITTESPPGLLWCCQSDPYWTHLKMTFSRSNGYSIMPVVGTRTLRMSCWVGK